LNLFYLFRIGTDIITRTPDVYIPYDDSYPFIDRIDDVVNYISKLKVELTFLYFEEPDAAGHIFGPESEEYRKKVIEIFFFFYERKIYLTKY
jgi:predicted AlkP superfamily pyrophosphatase or phosphodiesterase